MTYLNRIPLVTKNQRRLNTSHSQFSAVKPQTECLGHFAADYRIGKTLSSWEQSVEMKVDMEVYPGSSELPVAQKPVVLVVDDNEDNLSLLAFLVEQLDCTILTAINGQAALNLAQSYRPTLILLDMMLPDIDGIEVLSRLRQNSITATIPVIAVTAMARSQDRERILSAGCDEYVTKPFNVDEIEAMLLRYLGK